MRCSNLLTGYNYWAPGAEEAAAPNPADLAKIAVERMELQPVGMQGLGKVVVSGVWLGVMGAWGLWILG